jgi:hypothetical protein
MEKMKLIFLKKGEDKVIFGVKKSKLFTTLFPNFLLNCKLRDNYFLDDDFTVESMETYHNLFNDEYDMSILTWADTIFIEVRTKNIEQVTKGILNMAEFTKA